VAKIWLRNIPYCGKAWVWNVVKFMHRSIPEVLQKYLSQEGGKYSLNDAQVLEALAWTYLVAMRYAGVKHYRCYDGKSNADEINLSSSRHACMLKRIFFAFFTPSRS
jgi:hypothetical protein